MQKIYPLWIALQKYLLSESILIDYLGCARSSISTEPLSKQFIHRNSTFVRIVLLA